MTNSHKKSWTASSVHGVTKHHQRQQHRHRRRRRHRQHRYRVVRVWHGKHKKCCLTRSKICWPFKSCSLQWSCIRVHTSYYYHDIIYCNFVMRKCHDLGARAWTWSFSSINCCVKPSLGAMDLLFLKKRIEM